MNFKNILWNNQTKKWVTSAGLVLLFCDTTRRAHLLHLCIWFSKQPPAYVVDKVDGGWRQSTNSFSKLKRRVGVWCVTMEISNCEYTKHKKNMKNKCWVEWKFTISRTSSLTHSFNSLSNKFSREKKNTDIFLLLCWIFNTIICVELRVKNWNNCWNNIQTHYTKKLSGELSGGRRRLWWWREKVWWNV